MFRLPTCSWPRGAVPDAAASARAGRAACRPALRNAEVTSRRSLTCPRTPQTPPSHVPSPGSMWGCRGCRTTSCASWRPTGTARTRASVFGHSTSTTRRACSPGARASGWRPPPDQDVPRLIALRNWSVHYRPQSYSHDEPDLRAKVEDARVRITENALTAGANNPWFPDRPSARAAPGVRCRRCARSSTSSSTRLAGQRVTET